MPQGLINTGRFDDTTVQGDVAFQYSQTAIFGKGIGNIPHTTGHPVSVQGFIEGGLGAHGQVEPVARR